MIDDATFEAPRSRARVTRLGWVSFWLSVATTAVLWLFDVLALTGIAVGEPPRNTPEWAMGLAQVGIYVTAYGTPLLLPTSIALAVAAGWRGGRNRLAAVVGGVLMLSPLAIFVPGLINDL